LVDGFLLDLYAKKKNWNEVAKVTNVITATTLKMFWPEIIFGTAYDLLKYTFAPFMFIFEPHEEHEGSSEP